MKILQWGIFLVFVTLSSLAAQGASPSPMPSEPLIRKRAPDFSKWIITRNEAKPAAPKVLGETPKTSWGDRVVVTKTGKIMLRQILDEKGKTWNTWCIPELQITIWPDGKQWMLQSANPDPTVPVANYEDYSSMDFPGLEWVALKNYSGTEKLNGKECLVFKDTVVLEAGEEPVMRTAYVDSETRNPVAWKMGDIVKFYEFQPAPEISLKLPAIVIELVRSRQKLMNSATRKMPQN